MSAEDDRQTPTSAEENHMPKRRVGRFLLIGLLLVVVVLLGLQAYNFVRLDATQLSASATLVLERARTISERARPEYQDLALTRLPPNPHNGAFYRFDDNLHRAKVVDQPPELPTDDESVVLGYEFEDANDPGLIAGDGSAAPQIEAGLLRLPGHDGEDYLTNHDPLALRRAEVGEILVRARTDKKTWATLAWSSENEPEKAWEYRLDLSLIGDGEFHTYVINGQNALLRGEHEGAEVARLFIKPAITSDTDVEIDFIRFLSKRSRYLGARNDVIFEMVGGEMRKAIYMLPDQTLEWSVEVPEQAPVLEFGSAVLLSDRPVTFEAILMDENGDTTLHSETVTSATAWQDAKIDLAPWAGQSVGVRLRVSGDSDNVAFWSNPVLHSSPKDRFNVIIVLEDALRADYLSTYGYELETSPHKTALMRERGIQFDWAVSQATKTRPSVPSMMTSLYPTATGVWNFSDMLSDRHLTLAEIMRSQGFTTAAFIQNGNAGPWAGGHQGFSQLFDPRIVAGPPQTVLGERLFSWLEEHRDENFFLYLHVGDPHGPYDPPPPYDAWYQEVAGKGNPIKREDYLEPPSVTEPTDEDRRRRYAGEIRHNDELLATTVEKLDELGLTENTLVIFLADHGEFMGEQGHWEHHPPGLLPVIHVPLMMTYPSRFKEPKRITEVVQLVDVMPTVLELAGIERTDLLLQGDSLVSLIEGGEPERWRDRLAISEEPTAMERDQPCSCASLMFRDWHVISSTWLWPADRSDPILPGVHTFVKTHVYWYRDDPKEPVPGLAFLPDLYVRWLANDTVSGLREANQATWRKLTEGDAMDLQIDPDTLEHLRGLGYVN
jgi:arylsulfatase A-like enzyme